MKNFKIRTVGLVSLFFLLNAAFAPATPAAASPALDPAWSAPDVSVSLLRVLGALALVIGLFLAGVWLFRNGQRLAIPRGRAPQLNILEVRSLGGRQAIYVVGYRQERFLLASSPAGVSFLTHLPGVSPEDEPASETTGTVPFAQALARVLRGK